MDNDLMNFLVFYNLNRRHGSLRRELDVRTPFEALEKWYNLKPKIFCKKPEEIKNYLLNLKCKITQKQQQPCET
ncbi:hypothetical protein FACS1894201_03110 [Bacteroidia bacterium]|nr:hypothetical protein FACS1894201_03110 [Bacteroidia bacterium]